MTIAWGGKWKSKKCGDAGEDCHIVAFQDTVTVARWPGYRVTAMDHGTELKRSESGKRMQPGIDLIVVNYRTPDDLRGFLDSLRSHPPTVPWSLAIANVCPTRDDGEAAREFELPYDYIHFSQNVGYARAVNLAAQFGGRETIAIFNADTKLLNNVADECHRVLQSREDWGILGPRQIDSQGRITHGGFIPYERGFHTDGLHSAFSDVRTDATTVSGSAYFIKRTVWDELTSCPTYREHCGESKGAFLPTQHYFEETWCSYHARAHGHKVVYYGPATMIHEWHKASRVGGPADRQLSTSREMFREACEAHGI